MAPPRRLPLLPMAYQEFILKNAHWVASVESALRSITYILPGRFHDAELTSECLFAALNVLGLYHDKIILEALQKGTVRIVPVAAAEAANVAKLSQVAYNRYTRKLLATSATYRKLALALTLVQATQVLVEMAARRKWGDRGRWRVVLALETFKAVVRLAIFRMNGWRMLLHGLWPERDVDPEKITVSDQTTLSTAACLESSTPRTWRGKRTGLIRPHLSSVASPTSGDSPSALPSPSDITAYVLSKVLTVEAALAARDLVQPQPVRSLRTFAELIFILRPLLYVLAIRRYGTVSWRPWLLSLLLESWSRTLHHWAFGRKCEEGMTTLEREEMRRRKWLFLWYLLRNPLYEKFTRKRLNSFCESARQKPILSLFAGIIRDYQPLWEGVYFYTSAS